jgi:hypothetical protein
MAAPPATTWRLPNGLTAEFSDEAAQFGVVVEPAPRRILGPQRQGKPKSRAGNESSDVRVAAEATATSSGAGWLELDGHGPEALGFLDEA